MVLAPMNLASSNIHCYKDLQWQLSLTVRQSSHFECNSNQLCKVPRQRSIHSSHNNIPAYSQCSQTTSCYQHSVNKSQQDNVAVCCYLQRRKIQLDKHRSNNLSWLGSDSNILLHMASNCSSDRRDYMYQESRQSSHLQLLRCNSQESSHVELACLSHHCNRNLRSNFQSPLHYRSLDSNILEYMAHNCY
jgi:hypothetical protein